MSRITMQPSQIEHPKDPSLPPLAATVGASVAVLEEKAPEKTIWNFVKNLNPKEKIKFKDGSFFVFPASNFVTADKALAEKIRKVSEPYNIVENP